MPTLGSAGFAYYASVRGGTAFDTTTTDPSGSLEVPILAYEHFEVADTRRSRARAHRSTEAVRRSAC